MYTDRITHRESLEAKKTKDMKSKRIKSATTWVPIPYNVCFKIGLKQSNVKCNDYSNDKYDEEKKTIFILNIILYIS